MPNVINNKNKIFCKQNIPNMLVIFRIILTVAIIILLLLPTYNTIWKDWGQKSICGDPVYRLLSPFDVDLSPDPYYYYTEVFSNQLAAGILFLVACFSDWLDGYLARKNNWVSDFGKLWDPIADKILINSVLICFAYWQMVPAFVPIIMIARDVAVDADRMIAAKKNVVIAANWYGKAKTVIQMIACVVIFFFLNEHLNTLNIIHGSWALASEDIALWWGVQNLAMYAACLVSIVSAIKYFIEIAQKTKKVNNDQPKN